MLQRARLQDPLRGMWDAADVQWWWRLPRSTDALELPVWFDEVGPVAAVGLTCSEESCQVDVFAVSSIIEVETVWNAAMGAAARYPDKQVEILVSDNDALLSSLASQSGFAVIDGEAGTAWMEAELRPPVTDVHGFEIVDRVTRADRPHPMIGRNGVLVEERLRQCSLYDPTLELAVEDSEGRIAGYALFWFDQKTKVGLLEPMRVEDEFQRRGLGRLLLTTGIDRLARQGAARIKVGYGTDIAGRLYLGNGFTQTSVDRQFVRPPARQR